MVVPVPRITGGINDSSLWTSNVSQMRLTMKWSSKMNNGRGLSPLTFLFSISFYRFVDKMNVCSSILIQSLIGRASFFLQDFTVRAGKCFRREIFIEWKGESFHDVLEQLFRTFSNFSNGFPANLLSASIPKNLIEKGINKTRLTCGFTVA